MATRQARAFASSPLSPPLFLQKFIFVLLVSSHFAVFRKRHIVLMTNSENKKVAVTMATKSLF